MLHFYLIVVVVAVGSYLLGSIPFGYLLVKIFRGEDIRLTGSGNIGATNVARSGARGLGILTLILDTAKGLLAVGLAWEFGESSFNSCGYNDRCVHPFHLMAIAALFAVAGHVFPVWLKFKGGKGVATALGVFTLLFPKAVVVALVVFAVVLVLSRYVSLGSILAALIFPIAAYFFYHPDWASLLPVVVAALLVIAKHHQNIRRLLAGNENRFGGGKPAQASPTERRA